MKRNARIRYRLDLALAGLSAALAVFTLAWPDWIELIFGVDPDHGDGGFEWYIVAALAAGAVALLLLARHERTRARTSPA